MNRMAHLLSTAAMARFVRDGFLRFDAMIPETLSREVLDESREKKGVLWGEGNVSVYDVFPETTALGRALRLPALAGAIESLVGPDPRFDHLAAHRTTPGKRIGPNWHQDAAYDRRRLAFDVQVSIFPEETTPEMGGTLFLPGSHFRRVHESAITCYHHFVGQVQTVCPAGTVVIWHHNLWHAACSNRSDRERSMLKLRLNPNVRQERLWNTEDLHDPEALAPFDGLGSGFPWHGLEGRLEMMQRIRLWRFLTGDPTFDRTSWWTRIEAEPHAAPA